MPTTITEFEPLLAALATLVILSMILERALSVVFEWGGWRDWIRAKHLRAPIALATAYWMCVWGQFDVSAAASSKVNGYQDYFSFGTLVTAAVVAGGSKGAVLLFQGVLGFGRDAVNARVNAKSPVLPASGVGRTASTSPESSTR